MDNLKKHIHPGDVVLVEGKTRISQIIKYLTQSSWSHSAIYMGDRLVKDSYPHRTRYLERFGDEAAHLLVEADLAEGVTTVPLTKYTDYNLRVCRPYCITPEDLEHVLEEVVSHLGDVYDRTHIVDLGRYLTPFHLVPARLRRKAFFFGDSDSRSVICTTLIARAFLNVRYPVLPLIAAATPEEEDGHLPPYRRLRDVHPLLALPRDFDLSPYFRIIKFNSVEEGPVDYRSLEWAETEMELESRAAGGGK